MAAALLALLLPQLAAARIGGAAEGILAAVADYAPEEVSGGDHVTASGFTFRVNEADGVATSVSGEGELTDANVRFLGALVGAASGYGGEIAGPVADFLRSRAADLVGMGESPIEVLEYLLHLTVEAPAGAEEPLTLAVRFVPQRLSEDLFGAPARSLGPSDAPYVVREFTDLQCPFCALFAKEGMPVVRRLLERGDVRFEVHHFPLKSIHANAVVAAEALECVAEEGASGANGGGDAAFWAYHDALFENQERWAAKSDPVNTFLQIADEAGVAAAGLGLCVRSGRFSERIEAAYQLAAHTLNLTGTPSIFVGELKLSDYRNFDEYLRLMRLGDALRLEQAP